MRGLYLRVARPLLWASVSFLMASACSTAGGRQPPRKTGLIAAGIPVLVENHGFYDVKVYSEYLGVRFKLGTVNGFSTGTFNLNPALVGTVGPYCLVADYIGSSKTIKTYPIQVVTGGTTVWKLEQSYWLSTVVIR